MIITAGFNNLISLFRLFTEISKKRGKLYMSNFFHMFLDLDVLLFKYINISDDELHNLEKIFTKCYKAPYGRNYCLINMSDNTIYSNFEVKKIDDIMYLYRTKKITEDEKVFIENFIERYKCNSNINSYHICLGAKIVNNKNIFYVLSNDEIFNGDMLKYFTKNTFYLEDNYLNIFEKANIIMKDRVDELFSDYYIHVNRNIIENQFIDKTIILKFYTEYENNDFVTVIDIGSYDTSEYKFLETFNLIYFTSLSFIDNDSFYKFMNKIKHILSKVNHVCYEYNDFVIDITYYINITYTYFDLINFVKFLLFTKYGEYL